MSDRGSLNPRQVEQLLRPVAPSRVLALEGNSYLSQQDVRAHLIRVFGFGHWDSEILKLELIFEREYERRRRDPKANQTPTYTAFDVAYLCTVRLTVRDEHQQLVASYEDGSTGDAQAQTGRAAAHDLAMKSAISTALKRAATSLGDQFGLSLYNRGQQDAIVRGTLVGAEQAPEQDRDLQEGVPVQVGLGNSEEQAPQAEPEDEPAPPRPRQAVAGQQGVPRQVAEQTPEETPPEPAPAAEPEPAAEPAPEPEPVESWSDVIGAATTADELRVIWQDAQKDGALDPALKSEILQRRADLDELAKRASEGTEG